MTSSGKVCRRSVVPGVVLGVVIIMIRYSIVVPVGRYDVSNEAMYRIYAQRIQKLRSNCTTTSNVREYEDLLCMDTPKFLKEYKNPCWLQNNDTLRCLPYFHLIGGAKCGTSDFFARVLLHPDILGNKGFLNKETAFWSRRRFGYVHGVHGGSNLTRNERRKIKFNWFTSNFDALKLKNTTDNGGFHYKITGLGDPMDLYDRYHDYMMPQNPRGAEELLLTTPHVIKHMNPGVKLLLILRDPVERLYSHYFFSKYGSSKYAFHNDTLQSIELWKTCLKSHSERHCAFSRDLEVKFNCPIYAGFYYIHVREWLNAFPRDQILILRNEDYANDIRGTLINVFRYLDVAIPSEAILDKMSKKAHFRKTESKHRAGPMLNETRKLLVDLYRPMLENLAKLLDDDIYLFRDVNFK